MEVDALSAALAGSRLADYDVLRKIGGKDVTPGGMAATITMHGVCSYVYTVRSRRAAVTVCRASLRSTTGTSCII